MTPERWKHVTSVLDLVLEAAPAKRLAVIDDVCAGDEELRLEVESLIAFEDPGGDDSFMQSDAASAMQEVFRDQADTFDGRQIGKYKILYEIGAGGMGAVFLAERTDGEFDQKVAIKFLRQNFFSQAARARFVRERQILARLRHRFIAQMIDGGTTDEGTPYLVMEYVEGKTITEYSAENDLSLREKLDLFRNVCEAVSFAHRNLIVHRDLKPDNILMTADGIPKLLDFGIAKLLSNTDIKATVTRQQALTPDYAAPEQIAGRDVTTASDVYALGIILYELLTGTLPFRRRTDAAGKAWQPALSDEPLKPSAAATRRHESTPENAQTTITENARQKAIRKTLRGDLDTIVLKALRREPERRYASVEQFSRDLKSYLKGFPISARPDTFRYRTGKFLARNPFASAAVAAAFISLICGVIIAGYQAHRADVERARAERRFNEVRTLASSFMFEINDKISESPIKARELLVSRAIEYLDNLARESGNDAALQSELADSYEKIGFVQSEMFSPNLGKTSEALISQRKSLEIRQKLFDEQPNDAARGLDVVKSRLDVADILTMSGQIGEARLEYENTVAFCRQLLLSDPQNFSIRRNLASGYARLGQAVLRSGSLSEALKNYQSSLEIYRQLSAENPQEKNIKRSISVVFSFIGYVKMKMGELAPAAEYFNDSLKIQETLSSGDDSLSSLGHLSTANLWYGVGLSESGDFEKGLPYLRKALELQESIFRADKSNFGEQNALADCESEMGIMLLKSGQNEEASGYLQKALENYQTVWENDQDNLPTRRQIAYIKKYLADNFVQKGETGRALENYQSALSTMKELTDADPSNAEWQYDLALCYARLGEVFLKKDDRLQAFENFNISLPLLVKSADTSPENVEIRRDLEKVKKRVGSRNQ